MYRLSLSFLSMLFLIAMLAACLPLAGPAAIPDATSEPASPSRPTATFTLEPINLGGPEMVFGSKWLYADGSTLVAVPAGPFRMGREGGVDNPEHEVNLSGYWMYGTEVTNGQYAYCVAQGICSSPSLRDNPAFADPLKAADPVTGVTWEQANAYCEFVHGRLPTEAEWEKAARDPEGGVYPWGDAAPSCALLNFDNCVGKATNVTFYPDGQSYYGALDMSGNTYEWMADYYHPDYYLESPADDPPGPPYGEQRVVRSSGFDSGGNQAPVFSRFFNRPENHRGNLGFRCVVDDPNYFAPFCSYPAVYGTDGVGGSASGEQIQVDCPALSIDQSPGCTGTQPSTTVTLNGPAGSLVSVPEPACSALSSPGNTTCKDHGQVSICSQCTITTTGQPQCPEGYEYDANTQTCVGQPAPGECLPGFGNGQLGRGDIATSTPSAGGAQVQCCVANTVLGDEPVRGGVFPFCPAGTFFDGQSCISVEVSSPYCKSEGVALNSCQPGGETGCPVQSCPDPKIWYPDQCKCDYPPNW